MSKDYKPAAQKASPSRGSPFFTGLLIGILIGVGASVWVTMRIKGDTSPFEDRKINAPSSKDLSAKSTKNKDKTKDAEDTTSKDENPNGTKANDFDFYTILPDTESTVTEKEIKDNAATVKKDSYFLQVGAFTEEADADNMKAKLALQGFEAVVQTATIADKGTWHRVRVGPLSNLDQINKTRGDLTTAGFNTDLIKVHRETPPR